MLAHIIYNNPKGSFDNLNIIKEIEKKFFFLTPADIFIIRDILHDKLASFGLSMTIQHI